MKKLIFSLIVLTLSLNTFANEVATGFIKVSPGKVTGFPTAEKARVDASFAIIESVLNSEEFKNKVLNYKAGPDGFGYTSNRKMNNTQVYEFLMSGNELLGGSGTLGEMNFDLKRYWSSWFTRKVIGYTNPGKSNIIYGNGRKYSGMDAIDIASNVTHEWIHLMGFYHDSAADHDSVPYAVGYIVEDLARKFVKQGFLD